MSTTTTHITTLPLKALRAAALCGSPLDIRTYLDGVFVDVRSPTETFVVGTDGHLLGCYHHEQDIGDPEDAPPFTPWNMIIPMAHIKALGTPKGRWAPETVELTLTVTTDGDTPPVSFGALTLGDTRQTFTPIDSKFPDYMRVIPRTVNGKASHINLALLARFVAVGKALGVKENFVHLAQNGDGASLVQFASEPMIAVVMPMRGHETVPHERPDWFDSPREKEAKAAVRAKAEAVSA